VQTVGVTTTGFARDHADKLRKLIAARMKAVEFIYAHPEDSAAIVSTAYNLDKAVVLRAIKNLSELHYWSTGEFELAGMDNMVKGLQIVGEVQGPVEWAKVIDRSFLP
jgi:NitT/TauT family transport system substrate-binding protein